MKVKYFPKFDEKWVKLREVAYLAIYPDSYVGGQLFWMVDVHGVGERGNCQLANLENLYLGFIQPDKTRKHAYVTEDTKMAVDKYGHLMIYPTYSPNEFFDYRKMAALFNQVRQDWDVTPMFSMGGFSYGGGATVNYASSEYAPFLTNAWPIAPTNNVSNWINTKNANLPVHIFVNDDDRNASTNMGVTKKLIDGLNATFPIFKGQYTAFRATGHGDHNKVMALAPPAAPGGQGVINVAENIYEWSIDCWKNGPRQMKTGTAPTPTNPPTPTPTTAKADFNITDKQVITTSTFDLDGSASIGATSYYWEVSRNAPPWVGHNLEGGTIGGPKKRLTNLVDGPYHARLTINGSVKSEVRSFEVKLGAIPTDPVPEKWVTGCNVATKSITLDDGSTEKIVSASFKTESGKEYVI